jgi:glucan phosphoethanolaminetransferase (alkaline phosphatase superfamily)
MFEILKIETVKRWFDNSFGLVLLTALTSMLVALAEWRVFGFSLRYGLGRVANGFIMGFVLGAGLLVLREVLFFRPLKRLYTWFFFWLAVVLSIVEVFCLNKFSIKIGPSLIQIIGDTNNMSEITSFFDNYLDFMSLFTAFLLILLGFLVNRYAGKIADFLQKHSKLAVVGLAVLLATSFWGVGKVGGLSGSAPMIRGIYSVSYVYKIQQKLAEMTADKTNRVELLSDEGNLDYLIFIIGESASRHFMGCYGYDVDTTPYSDELVNSENMYVFTDTISPRSSTALVMPILLSFRDSLGKELDINKYDPLIDVFNKVNYQSYWLSNHEKITKDLSYATFVSSRCNETVFTSKSVGNVENYAGLCIEDGAMLPYFDNFLEQNKGNGQRSLYVFHFMGSHIRYRDRCCLAH